jgi:hypothetical protein
MVLRLRSPLACPINMKGGPRGDVHLHATMWKTLATTTSSRPKPRALPTRKVLANPREVFHPCTCALRGGTAMIANALISYDDMEVAGGMTTRRRWSWSTTSSTPTCDYVGPLLQLFFCCLTCLAVMIHDLLLASILGWCWWPNLASLENRTIQFLILEHPILTVLG